MFQVSAIIPKHGIKTMADGGIRLFVDTQELSPEQAAELFNLHGKQGWFLFKETDINREDIISLPEETKEFKNEKSPSERLRNVMFVYYEKKFNKTDGFEEWRRKQIESLIEQYKTKIND